MIRDLIYLCGLFSKINNVSAGRNSKYSVQLVLFCCFCLYIVTYSPSTKLHYKLAKLQLKTADTLNNVYGVRRQNYGELKNARNDTSINVFSILSSNDKPRTIER